MANTRKSITSISRKCKSGVDVTSPVDPRRAPRKNLDVTSCVGNQPALDDLHLAVERGRRHSFESNSTSDVFNLRRSLVGVNSKRNRTAVDAWENLNDDLDTQNHFKNRTSHVFKSKHPPRHYLKRYHHTRHSSSQKSFPLSNNETWVCDVCSTISQENLDKCRACSATKYATLHQERAGGVSEPSMEVKMVFEMPRSVLGGGSLGCSESECIEMCTEMGDNDDGSMETEESLSTLIDACCSSTDEHAEDDIGIHLTQAAKPHNSLLTRHNSCPLIPGESTTHDLLSQVSSTDPIFLEDLEDDAQEDGRLSEPFNDLYVSREHHDGHHEGGEPEFGKTSWQRAISDSEGRSFLSREHRDDHHEGGKLEFGKTSLKRAISVSGGHSLLSREHHDNHREGGELEFGKTSLKRAISDSAGPRWKCTHCKVRNIDGLALVCAMCGSSRS